MLRSPIFAAAIALLALSALAAEEEPAAKLKDGAYAGTAKGTGGPVEVEVVVADGKITSVKITKEEESEPGDALKLVPASIVEKQSAKVDAVTDATRTSKSVMAAVQNALEKAGAPPEPPPEDVDVSKLKDGKYTGAANGAEGPVEVEVVVAGGRITSVKITKEDESFPDEALTVVPARIVEKQKTMVDAVTDATWTSEAIMAAVRNALEKAGK